MYVQYELQSDTDFSPDSYGSSDSNRPAVISMMEN